MSIDPRGPPNIAPGLAQAIPTWRAAYSDRTCALMAAFCQLAYVPFELVQPPPSPRSPKLEVAGGREALTARLGAGGFRLIELFNRDDTQAYLAVSGEFAVLAFRGTTDFADWVTNLNALKTPLPGVPGVGVHRGFLSAYACCADEILQAVNAHVPPDLGLYITGHSLGGALAQIASAALERDNIAACYTFGSPRVGTSNFDRQVKCPHYRVVNNWDIVPGVPPPWFTGYRHTGDPRLLTPGSAGREALRRDRSGVSRFGVDVYALAAGLISRRFLVIDDHMIWNYRTQLEAIAAARAPSPLNSPGSPGATPTS